MQFTQLSQRTSDPGRRTVEAEGDFSRRMAKAMLVGAMVLADRGRLHPFRDGEHHPGGAAIRTSLR